MTPNQILTKLNFYNRQLDVLAVDLADTLAHIVEVDEDMSSLEFDYYLRTGKFPE